MADLETPREGGEFANKLIFFLKIYQYIKKSMNNYINKSLNLKDRKKYKSSYTMFCTAR